jgi:hypothetical protein
VPRSRQPGQDGVGRGDGDQFDLHGWEIKPEGRAAHCGGCRGIAGCGPLTQQPRRWDQRARRLLPSPDDHWMSDLKDRGTKLAPVSGSLWCSILVFGRHGRRPQSCSPPSKAHQALLASNGHSGKGNNSVSMHIIVNFTTLTVLGFDYPVTITVANDETIGFSGSNSNLQG